MCAKCGKEWCGVIRQNDAGRYIWAMLHRGAEVVWSDESFGSREAASKDLMTLADRIADICNARGYGGGSAP